MIVSFTIIRYKKRLIFFALMAMAIHRLALNMQKGCSFWKLLGTGKNGQMSLKPDWQQWAILATWENRKDFDNFYHDSFISNWWRAFKCERWTILCEPLQSHGKWGGKEPFGSAIMKDHQGPIVVLTRANVRYSKFRQFWKSVNAVTNQLNLAEGFIMSIGIGELYSLPATFSIWDNVEDMKAYAYKSGEHANVIKRARNENWLSEELFARFKPIDSFGTIKGEDPLNGFI
jgi:hypothetical protein